MALNPEPVLGGPAEQQNNDNGASIFNVERVELNFNIASDFVAGQVANNVLILALATNRILRIDLDNASDIDDVDLPKRISEIGLIRRMFLDPTASHLIITTTLGENFYLHSQSKQPKALSRLKNVSIECIAWNPAQPTASTREILIGATDGTIYETYIEPSTEFYRREERYTTQVHKVRDGAVTGIWTEGWPGRADKRRVLFSSHSALYYVSGQLGGKGREGSASIYAELFQKDQIKTHVVEGAISTAPSLLAVSPERPEDMVQDEQKTRAFAWLNSQGIVAGTLHLGTTDPSQASNPFANLRSIPRSLFPETLSARGTRKLIQDPIRSMTLTQFHVLALVEGRVVAVNRLNSKVVYKQVVLDAEQSALGLMSDLSKKNTFWLFTAKEIFEVVADEEDRDVWKTMLEQQDYDAALKYAKGVGQRDSVAVASGDHLSKKGQYLEAASIWGKSSKAFEEVCLNLIDAGQDEALKKYLLTKINTYKKSSTMQRTMIATWVMQIFMAKLNSLDDTIATKTELAERSETRGVEASLRTTRTEYQEFVKKHKNDLDAKTVYDIVSSHDREEELLFFADTIADYEYVLSYWIQRERWTDALAVLNKQSNPEAFYRYSNVLMTHSPAGLIEILMRRSNLEPEEFIPALLSYNETVSKAVPISQNQAVRYLKFVVDNDPSSPSTIHNTYVSTLASYPTESENMLLGYLESSPSPPLFDADFALRLCLSNHRVRSSVYIFSSILSQPSPAVRLALESNDIDLAASVVDRISPTTSNRALRKSLWLLIAKSAVQQSGTASTSASVSGSTSSIKSAMTFLKRSNDLLKIEDLIPLFPDFVVIDDFKDEICAALESYSRHIDTLKHEMDSSQHTAEQIRHEIAALDSRYAIVEAGEKCWICGVAVLARQFFVFPCQHAFHSDCLGKRVLESASATKKSLIRELQGKLSQQQTQIQVQGLSMTPQRQKWIRELDGIVGEQCVLCGDIGIRSIDEPFVTDRDDARVWAV